MDDLTQAKLLVWSEDRRQLIALAEDARKAAAQKSDPLEREWLLESAADMMLQAAGLQRLIAQHKKR